MLVEKYKPKHLSDILANPGAVKKVKEWIFQSIRGRSEKKVGVILGAAGTGKSSMVSCVIKDYNLDYIISNSSEKRNKDNLLKTFQKATLFKSLKGSRLLVLDDFDSIRKTSHRTIVNLIKESRFPFLIVCEDKKNLPAQIKNSAVFFDLRAPRSDMIFKYIKSICQKEKIYYEDSVLLKIAKESKNLRDALNSLESGETDETGKVHDIYELTSKIVFGFKDVREAFSNSKENPSTVLNWVEENVFPLKRGKKLALSYNILGKVDIFLARSAETYKMWKYAIYLLTDGMRVVRESEYRFLRMKYPGNFIFMGKRKRMREAFKPLAETFHVSVMEFCRFHLKVIRKMLKTKEDVSEFVKKYNVSENALKLILKKENVKNFLRGWKERRIKKTRRDIVLESSMSLDSFI